MDKDKDKDKDSNSEIVKTMESASKGTDIETASLLKEGLKDDKTETDDEKNGEVGNITEEEEDDTKDDSTTTINTVRLGEGEGIGKEVTIPKVDRMIKRNKI